MQDRAHVDCHPRSFFTSGSNITVILRVEPVELTRTRVLVLLTTTAPVATTMATTATATTATTAGTDTASTPSLTTTTATATTAAIRATAATSTTGAANRYCC